jgi:hypothetical protein
MGPLKGSLGPLRALMGQLKGPDGVPLGPQWGPIWAQLFINDFLILFFSINPKPHLLLPFLGFFLYGTLSGTPWALLGTLLGPLLGTPGLRIRDNCYPSYHLTLALRKSRKKTV